MKNKFYKTVLLSIQVSVGDFCWGEGRICGHFDNEGGHPACGYFHLQVLKPDEKGRVIKLAECRDLREAEVKTFKLDQYKKALRAAAEDLYQSDIVDTEMEGHIVGIGNEYESKEFWIEEQMESWLKEGR